MRKIDADAFEVVTTNVPDGFDPESYIAGMNMVLEKLAAAPTVDEWISVEERKPDEGELVQAYSKKADRQFVGCRVVYGEGEQWEREQWKLEGARGRSYSFPCKVTHWKPLTEPPKED